MPPETTIEAAGVLWPDPDDPEWQGFCNALLWLLGSTVPGRCQTTCELARGLLEARGYDADASLEVYERSGGYCDCEVLMNTDDLACLVRLDDTGPGPEGGTR